MKSFKGALSYVTVLDFTCEPGLEDPATLALPFPCN